MLALTFPYLLGERNTQQGTITPHSALSVSHQISSRANQIPLNVGFTGQTRDQPSGVLPTDFSSSLSSITLHDDLMPVERPLFAESLVQPHIHPPGPPSSFPTRTNSDIYPQIAVVLDANIAMSSGARRTRDTRRDMAHPIPMEISRHENESESVPSNTDIDEYTTVPGG